MSLRAEFGRFDQVDNPVDISTEPQTTFTTTEIYQHRLIESKLFFSISFILSSIILIESIPSSSIFHPKICPNAFWNSTGITIASFPDLIPDDFFLNQYDEIYLPDRKNRLIRKYIPGNDSLWITAVASKYLIDPTAIFVDLDQNIYIWDCQNSRVYFWSFMNKNIRILLSFDGCNQSVDLNEICFGKSLFIDSNSSIYISENSEKYPHTNRVMKFEANSTIGRVIAGTSTFGSGMQQLHSPGTILVDSQGMLYVADVGNSRIQAFQVGNRNGHTKISMEGLSDFMMDEDGQFYVAIESENVIKRTNGENIIRFVNQPRRIRFAIDGSIYVLNQGNSTIQKFQIINNIC